MSSPEYLRLLEVFSRADGDVTSPLKFTVLRLESGINLAKQAIIDTLEGDLDMYLPPIKTGKKPDSDYCICLMDTENLPSGARKILVFGERRHQHYRHRPLALCNLKENALSDLRDLHPESLFRIYHDSVHYKEDPLERECEKVYAETLRRGLPASLQ